MSRRYSQKELAAAAKLLDSQKKKPFSSKPLGYLFLLGFIAVFGYLFLMTDVFLDLRRSFAAFGFFFCLLGGLMLIASMKIPSIAKYAVGLLVLGFLLNGLNYSVSELEKRNYWPSQERPVVEQKYGLRQ